MSVLVDFSFDKERFSVLVASLSEALAMCSDLFPIDPATIKLFVGKRIVRNEEDWERAVSHAREGQVEKRTATDDASLKAARGGDTMGGEGESKNSSEPSGGVSSGASIGVKCVVMGSRRSDVEHLQHLEKLKKNREENLPPMSRATTSGKTISTAKEIRFGRIEALERGVAGPYSEASKIRAREILEKLSKDEAILKIMEKRYVLGKWLIFLL